MIQSIAMLVFFATIVFNFVWPFAQAHLVIAIASAVIALCILISLIKQIG